MGTEQLLLTRSESKCELCGATDNLSVYNVPPHADDNPDECILTCGTCHEQIENPDKIDANHWMAWRMLTRLRAEGWPQDLLDMLYLDDDTLAWAKSTGEGSDDGDTIKHLDSNGAQLTAGDTVTLIKDLNVKGAGFTAKRGTAVRGISLVPDNAEHIEGRVEGQHIVILTKFVKKSN